MNMDVNLHRLPELILYSSKFLVPFTVFMLSLQLTNLAAFFYHKKIVFTSNPTPADAAVQMHDTVRLHQSYP